MQTSLFLPVNRPLWTIMYHLIKNDDNMCDSDALQLEAAQRRGSRFPLNYEARTKFEVDQPYNVYTADALR